MRKLLIVVPLVLIALGALLSVGVRVAVYERFGPVVMADLRSGEATRAHGITTEGWVGERWEAVADWIAMPAVLVEHMVHLRTMPADDPDLVRIRAALARRTAEKDFEHCSWTFGMSTAYLYNESDDAFAELPLDPAAAAATPTGASASPSLLAVPAPAAP